MGEHRLDRHLRPDGHVVGGHHRADSVLGVGRERADVLPLGLGEARQDRFALVLGQPLVEVGPLVRLHRGEHLAELGALQRSGEGELIFGREIAEDLRLLLHRQGAKHGRPDRGGESRERVGDVERMPSGELAAHAIGAAVREKGGDPGGLGKVGHSCVSSGVWAAAGRETQEVSASPRLPPARGSGVVCGPSALAGGRATTAVVHPSLLGRVGGCPGGPEHAAHGRCRCAVNRCAVAWAGHRGGGCAASPLAV